MTTLIRWNPVREMAAMQSAMDRLFDETWRNARPALANTAIPLDVHETSHAYTVTADLPGLTSDQINISLHDGVLTISAEIAQPEAAEDSRALLQERTFGKFSRSIRLPQQIDNDNVEATYENGVLTLTLPKSPEAQPRNIPVRNRAALEHSNN